MTAHTELILRCDQHGVIKQVISNTTACGSAIFLNNSIVHYLSGGSIDQGLHFLHDVQRFGRADNCYLDILINDEVKSFVFSGALLQDNIIMIGTSGIMAIDSPETLETTQITDTSEQSQALQEALLQTSNQELLEEMSRLNNELINTKRELIRKNLELERLQRLK